MAEGPRELAGRAAAAAEDKKARDVMVLDLREITPVTDFFVIASAGSSVQVKAIVDGVEEALDRHGRRPCHREGYDNGRWVLLDYGDLVVHVFHQQERDFYQIERLWADAPIMPAGDLVAAARRAAP